MEKIKKNRFSKVLVLLLAVMMIFTMMPSMAFAAETADMPILQNAENGAGDADASQSPDAGKNAEGQPENGQIQLTLSGMHSAQVASLKLYAYDGGQKGTTDLLSGITAVDGAYTVSLDAGSYWVEGYDANGDCNGGMTITADESHKEFKIQRIYELSVSPSNWKMGEDYALDVKVTPAGSTESRTVALGKTINGKGQTWESTKNTCIFAVGDTVEAAAAPDAVKHPNYNPATISKTPTINDSLSVTCKEFVTVDFKVPAGSTITVGTLANYYVYSYKDAEKSNVEDGTATYHLDKNTDYFYRVQNPKRGGGYLLELRQI